MNENTKIKNSKLKRKTDRNISEVLFPLFSFISAAFFLTIAVIAIIIMGVYFHIWIPSLLCIVGAIILYSLMSKLDRSEKFTKLFQIKKINLRWLFIILINSIFSIVIFIIYFIISNLQTPGLEASQTSFSLIVFLFGTVFLNIAVFLIYFGIKNKKTTEIHKVKFTFFKIFSMFFLILSIGGLIFIFNNYVLFPPPNILKGTGYNEGPWLTWYDNKPDENICITWLTEEKNLDSKLNYGTNPGDLDKTEVGSGKYVHKVYLEGLKADTIYYYKIPDIDNEIFSFRTASDEQEAFKFAIVGDMQPNSREMRENCKMVAKGVAAGDYDFIVQLGDIADSGAVPDDWHKVLESVSILGSERPFQAVIGNHDWAGGIGSSNWAELFTYNYAKPHLGRFYSFDYHNAHFVMIDNFEHYYKMSEIQLNWIKNDIQKAKDDGQDWIFCAFHLSMMTVSTSGMYYDLQEMLVPIFDEYGVDAVFFAHDHDYQHYRYTYGGNDLIYNKNHNWDHNEIHYFCSGGGGANLEVSYGVLNKDHMERTDKIKWWDENKNKFRVIEYERKSWDSDKYITHPAFEDDYSWNDEDKYYYYLAEEATYNEFAEEIGFEYGEQCYHYVEIQIDDNNCTISVKYPNGDLLRGPGDFYQQQWQIIK